MNSVVSSSTALAANGTWISGPVYIRPNADGMTLIVDGSSDANGVAQVQESTDGTTFLTLMTVTCESGRPFHASCGINRNYWRVVYTNGATAQTRFLITVTATQNVELAMLRELQNINLNLALMMEHQPPSPRDIQELVVRS